MTMRWREFHEELVGAPMCCTRDDLRLENAGIHKDLTGIPDHPSPLVEVHAAFANTDYASIALRAGRNVPCLYRSSIECFNE